MAAQTDALWHEIAIPCLDQVKIPLERYRGSPKALRYRLLRKAYRHLRNDTGWPTMVQLDALDRAAHAAREEKWLHLPGGIRGVVGGGKLVMGRMESLMPGHLYYHVSFPGETEIRESDLRIQWEILEDRLPKGWPYHRDVVYMDVRAIRGELILRGPARGDRLRPLGLGGTKKVQDILVDRHIPRRERWRVPLLVDEAGVLWVIGHCLDERVKIKPNTREILKATLQHLGQHTE